MVDWLNYANDLKKTNIIVFSIISLADFTNHEFISHTHTHTHTKERAVFQTTCRIQMYSYEIGVYLLTPEPIGPFLLELKS